MYVTQFTIHARPPASPSVSTAVHQSVRPSVQYVILSVRPPDCPSVRLSVGPRTGQFILPSVHPSHWRVHECGPGGVKV